MLHVYSRAPDAAARYRWGGSHPVSSGHAHGHAQPTSGSWSPWRQGWLQSVEPEQMDYPQGPGPHSANGASWDAGPRARRAHVPSPAEDAARPWMPSHTMPCERGGLTMLELQNAMKQDAMNQEGVAARLGSYLDRVVDCRLMKNTALPQFDGLRRCCMPPSAFLARILRYGHASPCCLVVAMAYMERINERLPSVCLTAFNMQRLLLTLVMLASKCLDDFFCSNKQWALIGDLPILFGHYSDLHIRELNRLELDILVLLDFNLAISRENYDRVNDHLHEVDMKTFRAHLSDAESPQLAPAAFMPQSRSPPAGSGRPDTAAQGTAAAKRTVVKAVKVAAQRHAHEIFDEQAGEASRQAVAAVADAIPKGPSPRQDEETLNQQREREKEHHHEQSDRRLKQPLRPHPAGSAGLSAPRVNPRLENVRRCVNVPDIELSSPVKPATFAAPASYSVSAKANGTLLRAERSADQVFDSVPEGELQEEYYDIPIPPQKYHEGRANKANMPFEAPVMSPAAANRSQYLSVLTYRQARQLETEQIVQPQAVQPLSTSLSQLSAAGMHQATPAHYLPLSARSHGDRRDQNTNANIMVEFVDLRQEQKNLTIANIAPYHVTTPRTTHPVNVNTRQASPSRNSYSPGVYTTTHSHVTTPRTTHPDFNTRQASPARTSYSPGVYTTTHSEYKQQQTPRSSTRMRISDHPNYALPPTTPVTARQISQPQHVYRTPSGGYQHSSAGQQRTAPFAPHMVGLVDAAMNSARMSHIALGSPAAYRAGTSPLVRPLLSARSCYWHQGWA